MFDGACTLIGTSTNILVSSIAESHGLQGFAVFELTPLGYQTNTLVYGPGQHRFTDFTRIGVWLNLLFWTCGSWLIPVLWPLQAG
jgi:di/tricarboxylate transporter